MMKSTWNRTNERAADDSVSWVEKYRPKTLDDITGHPAIVRSFRHYTGSGHMPNLLLTGPPGSSKTTLLHCLGRELYGSDFKLNFKEWNSSDARGIDVVRGPIKKEAEYGPKGNHKWKILYLGEMDGMTHAAQDALKRTMELAYRNVRFVADANNLEQIIPAIQSRFCHFTVPQVPENLVVERLFWICGQEDVQLPTEVLEAIVRACRGDMRQSIELLEGLPYDGEPITTDLIRELAPTPDHKKVAELVAKNWNTRGGNFYEDREHLIRDLMRDDPSCKKIVEIMFDFFEINGSDWEGTLREERWRFMLLCGEYEIRVRQGNPVHQLRVLLEQIYQLRNSL